jgi:site-specific recombinase XerD
MFDQKWLARFEEHLVRTGMSPATIANYCADIRGFLAWLSEPGDDRLDWMTVSAVHVQQYCQALSRQGRSISTINRRLQAVRKFFDYLVHSGSLASNPAREVERLHSRSTSSPRILTHQEVRDLLAAVGNGADSLTRRDRAMLLLLLETGIKVSELVSLRLDDLVLDVGSGYILVGQDLEFGGRCISIGPETCAAIRASTRLRAPAAGVDHLFVSRQGRPLSARTVQRIVSGYAQAAGLEGVSTQTLRHTFAHDVIETMDDLSQVARMLGLKDESGVSRYME